MIDNSIFYRIVKINRIDKKYSEIYNAIINNKEKLQDIILAKYFINNEVLYYKNRL